MEYEVVTELNKSDIFNVAHEFTTLRGSEFSPIEVDFLFAFVSQVEEKDEVFKEYSIEAESLSVKMERRMRRERVSELFDSLIGKYIALSKEGDEKRYSIFDTLSYNRKEDLFSVKFSSEMKRFLLKLKPFTKGYLSDIFKIQSVYSKKIYLLCAQWQKAGSFTIKVDKLMKDLQVPETCLSYGEFKRKILKVAEKNMLEKSSIFFEYQEKKDGKKVDELVFIIKEKVKKELKKEEPKLFELDLSTTQKELEKYVGKKINDHTIKCFRIVGTDIFVDTSAGEYRFPNIETLRENIK